MAQNENIGIIRRTSTVSTTALAKRKIEYIVIHYTAGVTSKTGSAVNVAAWFASGERPASADFAVDNEQIVQYNPDVDNRYCWHCGDVKAKFSTGGSYYGICRNPNSIGIEICSSNRTGKVTTPNDPYFFFTPEAVTTAVRLTKYLMEKYGIDADHVIRHWDVSGKLCPGIEGWNGDSGNEAEWKKFKDRIAGKVSENQKEHAEEDKADQEKCMEKRYKYVTELPEWAQPPIRDLMKRGILLGDGNDDLDKRVIDMTLDMARCVIWADRIAAQK